MEKTFVHGMYLAITHSDVPYFAHGDIPINSIYLLRIKRLVSLEKETNCKLVHPLPTSLAPLPPLYYNRSHHKQTLTDTPIVQQSDIPITHPRGPLHQSHTHTP